MTNELINILKNCATGHGVDQIAKLALKFIESADDKSFHLSGPGQSSLSIAKIYKIRMKHKTFRPEAFEGLEQSIEALDAKDVIVRLAAVETDKGVVSVWLNGDDEPVGIVVGKYS